MRKPDPLRCVLLLVLLSAVAVGSVACQRFDAAEPLQEQVGDQFTNFPRSTKAFLDWCVDEWTGNPASLGP